MAKRLVKVRVYYKLPCLGAKSVTMKMTEKVIAWNRANKMSSPYKRIVRIK